MLKGALSQSVFFQVEVPEHWRRHLVRQPELGLAPPAAAAEAEPVLQAHDGGFSGRVQHRRPADDRRSGEEDPVEAVCETEREEASGPFLVTDAQLKSPKQFLSV